MCPFFVFFFPFLYHLFLDDFDTEKRSQRRRRRTQTLVVLNEKSFLAMEEEKNAAAEPGKVKSNQVAPAP